MTAKTIAQMAILNWINAHFGMSNMNIEFTGTREASLVDENGDQLTLIYDSSSREVYPI